MPRTLDGQSGSLNLWGKFGVKKKKLYLKVNLRNGIVFISAVIPRVKYMAQCCEIFVYTV